MFEQARMHRLGRLTRDRKDRIFKQKKIEGLTRPAENFVTPERGRIEQMLHQCIVSPETHPINHTPLNFLLFICGTFRKIGSVLEDIGGVVC
jgi:hypothetical protein